MSDDDLFLKEMSDVKPHKSAGRVGRRQRAQDSEEALAQRRRDAVAEKERDRNILADEGIDATLWDPRVLKPIDAEMIRDAAAHPLVVTVEDGVRVGGFGSSVSDLLQRRAAVAPRVLQLGTPDEYLPHGDAKDLHHELGLDPAGIAASVRKSLLRDSD